MIPFSRTLLDMSMFLNERELTDRRAVSESFVKKIVVMPDNNCGALHDSDARRQRHTGERRRGDGAERIGSVYRQVWWASAGGIANFSPGGPDLRRPSWCPALVASSSLKVAHFNVDHLEGGGTTLLFPLDLRSAKRTLLGIGANRMVAQSSP